VLNPGDIPVVATNRGGQVTYHGPGQVVAYPLLDLQRMGYFVKEYVYRLEDAVIRTLDHFGVTGHRVAGAPASMCAWTTRAAMPCWSSAPAARARQPAPDPISPAWARLPPWASRSAATAPTTGGAQRRYGPGTLLAHQPLRLRRAETVDLSTIGVQTTWDEAAPCWAAS
jgi:lipoyl(octanoyl) transferase